MQGDYIKNSYKLVCRLSRQETQIILIKTIFVAWKKKGNIFLIWKFKNNTNFIIRKKFSKFIFVDASASPLVSISLCCTGHKYNYYWQLVRLSPQFRCPLFTSNFILIYSLFLHFRRILRKLHLRFSWYRFHCSCKDLCSFNFEFQFLWDCEVYDSFKYMWNRSKHNWQILCFDFNPKPYWLHRWYDEINDRF